MIYVRDADGSVQSVGEKLRQAVAANGMNVIGAYDLREKLGGDCSGVRRQCLVFEVCHPRRTARALDADMSLSTVLPARISVYEHGGRVRIASLKPMELLGMFDHPDLDPIAQEAENAVVCIIDAACR